MLVDFFEISFANIVLLGLIISLIFKWYINYGSKKIKKEELETIREQRKVNIIIFLLNPFLIKPFLTLLFSLVMFFFLDNAISALDNPLSSISLSDILSLVVVVFFGYAIYAIWFSSEDY